MQIRRTGVGFHSILAILMLDAGFLRYCNSMCFYLCFYIRSSCMNLLQNVLCIHFLSSQEIMIS